MSNSLKKLIIEDYRQIFRVAGVETTSVSFFKILLMIFKNRGFRAVFLYRIGRQFRKNRMRLIAVLLEKIMHHLCFCEISTTADIGPGFAVFHPFGLVVGTDVRSKGQLTLSMDVVLGGNLNKAREDGSNKPLIGFNVNIASGSKIVGPVTIGDNVLIGANTVVISDIPNNCVVAGVPARILKRDNCKIWILEQEGELYDILRSLKASVERLEKKISNSQLD